MTPGQRITPRFEVEREVAVGGMATIYRALDRETGEPVALKVIRHYEPGDPSQETARFEREARVLAELRHPAVVRYVAHGTTESGAPYLAMEWLEGEDLGARLAREELSLEDSIALGLRVAEALAAVHGYGLVHRDIKPANLFLVGGNVAEVKLIDFGLARTDYASILLTRSGIAVGTPGYMAPEQARGQRDVDARADLFSLGCVLFKCVTGRPPFHGRHLVAVLTKVLLEDPPRVSELRPEVPQALAALLTRLLRKDPSERPSSATAVASALGALDAVPRTDGGERSERGRPPPSSAPSSLTAGEQRVLAMLLIGARSVTGGVVREDETMPLGLVENTPPDRRRLAYDGYITALVREHGGQSDRLVDGTWLVTFVGAGVATDLSARAARCGLALRAALPGLPIALAMVRSVVMRGLPVGDAIDRAANMLLRAKKSETGARAGVIAIDEVAAALLDGRFDVARGDGGFELQGMRGLGASARTLLGRPTACVGRDWELSSMERLLDDCVDEQVAGALLVTGAAGMGKSRLLHELVTSARGRVPDLEVWIGRGDSLRAGSAFGLLGEALRGACGIQEGEPPGARWRKVRDRVARHVSAADAGRVAEFLGELVGAPFPDDDSPPLRAARQDTALMSEQLRRAWEDFLDAEAAVHPVLLVLDDLHWGDLATVRFVDAALRRLERRPWMALALARPEVHELFPKLWDERGVQEIRVKPLSPKASERLVRQALGDAVSAETAARIAAQADGNAFYLEELIRAVAENKVDGAGAAFPETVLAMVQARLEGLEVDARRVLRAASVFGEVFWPGALSALLGPAGALTAGVWIEELLARELLVRRPGSRFAGEPELAFRHALLRQGAYGMLTERDRELGHRLAAAWLERHGEGDPTLLAQHFERGRDVQRAVSEYLRAAEQALRGEDHEAAIAAAERGVACGASGEELGRLRMIKAEARYWRAEYPAAERHALAAAGVLTPGTARWFNAMNQVVRAANRLGSFERVEQCVASVQGAVPCDGALEAQIVCLCECANHLTFAGRYPAADQLIDAVHRIAEDLPALEAPVQAALRQTRAYRTISMGDLGASLEAHSAAFVAYEQAGDRRNTCRARSNIGYLLAELGDVEGAEETLRALAVESQRMGLHGALANARHNLGLVVAYRGRIDEGRRLEEQALEAFVKQGDPRAIGGARIYLARIGLIAGDFAEAEREAGRAAEAVAAVPALRPAAFAALASALLGLGRVGEALSAARAGMAVLESLGQVEDGESLVRLVYAEALRAGELHAEFVEAIGSARASLLARAARISDPAKRERFLTAVPDNARTIALAEEAEPTREAEPTSRSI